MCMRCCREDETINHLFFGCDYAQATWRGSGLPNPIVLNGSIGWEDKIRALFQYNTSNQHHHISQLPLWILWRLWKSRNTLIFDRRNIHWNTNLNYAKRDAKEWHDAENYQYSTLQRHQRVTQQRCPQHWTKPPQGWHKCNYDGTYNAGLQSKGGWIIRDERGTYLGAGHGIGGLTNNALESELHALIMAMQSCWVKGYKKIVFEGDNKEAGEILNDKISNFAAFNWLRDIRHWRHKFEDCRFVWTRRDCNMAADTLAKEDLPQRLRSLFYNFVPSSLVTHLHRDFNLANA